MKDSQFLEQGYGNTFANSAYSLIVYQRLLERLHMQRIPKIYSYASSLIETVS